ncbi:MAG TPA: hypothetical protein EYH16_04125 [Leucothrix mucor]|nr:hypothetical protein [Leucothrix mucor]
MKKQKAKLKAKQLHKSRNPIANSAIMRKGGVHEKTRKAKRQKLKRELRATLSKTLSKIEPKTSGNYKDHVSDPFLCLC